MPNAIEIAKAVTSAYNEKNWDKARTLVTENVVYDEKGTGRRIQGVGQLIEAWQGWAKAYPDSKATFMTEFGSGDIAVLEIVWKGTHTGPLPTPGGTIPATNKRIDLPACQVVRVENGKMKSCAHYFDMVTMLTQIGAMQAGAAR